MTTNKLKFLAIILMTVDHIGAILFPDLVVLRLIGRLSFPIFAFVLVQGFRYTSNVKKYFIRLFTFALISEPIYDFAFYGQWFYPDHSNIFFTLLFGLLIIYIFEQSFLKEKFPVLHVYIMVPATMMLSTILHVDYGLYGILMIVMFYLINDFKYYVLWFFLLNISYVLFNGLDYGMQFFSILALLPIYFYNKKLGKKIKKQIAYMYYPVHLILLTIIEKVVGM